MNKTLIITFLFIVQNSYCQEINWSLSECIKDNIEMDNLNINSKVNETDSIFIDFIIVANCSGIHDFKTTVSNDTLFIDYKQGTLSLMDSIEVEWEQVIFDSINQNYDTIVQPTYIYTQSTEIAECDCYYNLKISFLKSIKLTGLSFIGLNRKNYLQIEETKN